MAFSSKKDLFDFLQVSKTFCRQIDNHIKLLGLNATEIQNYKYSSRFFINLAGRQTDDVLDEKMLRNQIENLHVQFTHLVQECKNSKGYSLDIGTELGIERRLLVAGG